MEINNPYIFILNLKYEFKGRCLDTLNTFIKDNTIHYMNHYVLDYNRELASNYFTQSKEVIRFYEKYFEHKTYLDM